jgi:hypothetical protein
MICSAGNFRAPEILIEAMVELGEEFEAGACARTASAAKSMKWMAANARRMRLTAAI